MKESVAIAKETNRKKEFSPTRSGNSIHRVRNASEKQLGSLRAVIGNIRRNGGTPSVESIATHVSSMHTAQRASVLLALQRTHGNHYVQRVVTGIQAKLKVGQPGDIYEQEADRVADAVMRMSEPEVQRQAEEEEKKKEEEKLIQTKPLSEQITPLVQRQAEEKEEEESIMAKSVSGTSPQVGDNIYDRLSHSRGGSQPLPEHTRNFMGKRFGVDFSGVRIHTDSDAVKMSNELNALAFTHGRDIYFGAGRYNPGTSSGKRLLAHELTHVLQQGTKSDNIIQTLSDPDCSTRTSLPLSSSCRGGFIHTCYSETVLPSSSSALHIEVSVDYTTPPPPYVAGREDFSVQVYKCGVIWDTHIGSKRISSGLPATLSFSIASVTPGDKYYIKIYSRSHLPLDGRYHIWQ